MEKILSSERPIRQYAEKGQVRITSDSGAVVLTPDEARQVAKDLERDAKVAENWG